MKLKLIVLSVACIVATMGNAQFLNTGEDTVYYEMQSNDPNRTFFSIGGTAELSIKQYTYSLMSFGLESKLITKRFAFDINARIYALEGEMNDALSNNVQKSVYEPEASRDLTFCGTVYFTNVVENENLSLKMKQRNDTAFYANFPADRGFRFGIDLGLTSGATRFNFSNSTPTGTLEDGTTDVLGADVASYFSFSTLRFGLSRTTIDQVRLTTKKYGDKDYDKWRKLYVHGLVLLTGKIDDIYSDHPLVGGAVQRYDLNEEAEFYRFGVAVGFKNLQLNSMFKVISVSTDIEGGFFPAPKSSLFNSLYLDIKLGFHFGTLFK